MKYGRTKLMPFKKIKIAFSFRVVVKISKESINEIYFLVCDKYICKVLYMK